MKTYTTGPWIGGYPENSPFDLNPPLYNLVPEVLDSGQHDTEELLVAALAIAQKTDVNCFCRMYGTNPLHTYGPQMHRTHLPWPDDTAIAPPPPPDITLPAQFQILGELNPTGNNIIFLVEVDGAKRLLKIFPDRKTTGRENSAEAEGNYTVQNAEGEEDGDDDEDGEDDDDEDEEDNGANEANEVTQGSEGVELGNSENDDEDQYEEDNRDSEYDYEDESWESPMAMFERESHAYAHLLHFGACKSGVVPNFYGCTTLSTCDVDKLLAVPSVSEKTRALADDERPPKAILIEHFSDAERLSDRNITPEVAQAALRTLHLIHTAYVSHGDIHARNILLLPDGRVVWVDFDHASCVEGSHLSRRELLTELAIGWDYMYLRLLPDKRIGYTHAS